MAAWACRCGDLGWPAWQFGEVGGGHRRNDDVAWRNDDAPCLGSPLQWLVTPKGAQKKAPGATRASPVLSGGERSQTYANQPPISPCRSTGSSSPLYRSRRGRYRQLREINLALRQLMYTTVTQLVCQIPVCDLLLSPRCDRRSTYGNPSVDHTKLYHAARLADRHPGSRLDLPSKPTKAEDTRHRRGRWHPAGTQDQPGHWTLNRWDCPAKLRQSENRPIARLTGAWVVDQHWAQPQL